jgi:hypothetical protein
VSLTDGFAELALLAARTVVSAAATDTWQAAKRGVARLLGRGDPAREQLAERWAGRLADLLEEMPGVEADLRGWVDQVRALLPAGVVSAAGHDVAAGRDVAITASGGGVAAGTIHGDVAPPGPRNPNPASG